MPLSLARAAADAAISSAPGRVGAGYAAALDLALSNVRPNFETPAFESAFRSNAIDRQQFASLLASNLYMEGYSAGRLKQYAGLIEEPRLKRDLFRHASDEARHSRLFFDLMFLVFPELDEGALKAEAERNVVDLDAVSLCPESYPAPPPEELLNSLILMNLFEIKAHILGTLIQPFIVAHAPGAHAGTAGSIIDGIVRDERHHIAYTARYIDRFIDQLGENVVAEKMAGFMEMMNASDDFQF